MSYLVGSRRSLGRMGIMPIRPMPPVYVWEPPIKYPPPVSPQVLVTSAPDLPVMPGPMPRIPGPYPDFPGSVYPIVHPITTGPLPPTPGPSGAASPVPAGYPTNQIFVAPNGSFWEYSSSQNQWVNVGTPYNTGAVGIPPAVPSGSTPSGAPTSAGAPTVAPAPVTTVSIAPASSTYADILNWLEQDTLGATIGFSIPNWILVGGAAALAWKFYGSSGKKRGGGESATIRSNPSRRTRRARRRY
jgi:hypothetical protein